MGRAGCHSPNKIGRKLKMKIVGMRSINSPNIFAAHEYTVWFMWALAGQISLMTFFTSATSQPYLLLILHGICLCGKVYNFVT